MDGIIAVFFVYEGIENTDVLFSLFLASDPSPVWKTKKPLMFKQTLSPLSKSCHCHKLIKSYFICVYLKMSYPCLNVYTSKLHLVSSVHTATYIPILYLMLVLSHLWHVQEQMSVITLMKYLDASFPQLTNWWEVFSVCEPQSWSDIW